MIHGSGDPAWITHSDERIKENITELTGALDTIDTIRCVKYNLKDKDNTSIGFIAQDWENTEFAEVVNQDFGMELFGISDVKGISYTNTIPVLMKALQELKLRVVELENRLN